MGRAYSTTEEMHIKFSLENLGGRDLYRDESVNERLGLILRRILDKFIGCGLDSTGSGYNSMTDFFEHCDDFPTGL
jgi:hypothetical protein